jgi:hypothetical protein
MMMKKRDIKIFIIGLSVGVLVLSILYACQPIKKQIVDLSSAKAFMTDKNIDIVAFIDKYGNYYVTDKDGKKIKSYVGNTMTETDEDESGDENIGAHEIKFYILHRGLIAKKARFGGSGDSFCWDPVKQQMCSWP